MSSQITKRFQQQDGVFCSCKLCMVPGNQARPSSYTTCNVRLEHSGLAHCVQMCTQHCYVKAHCFSTRNLINALLSFRFYTCALLSCASPCRVFVCVTISVCNTLDRCQTVRPTSHTRTGGCKRGCTARPAAACLENGCSANPDSIITQYFLHYSWFCDPMRMTLV